MHRAPCTAGKARRAAALLLAAAMAGMAACRGGGAGGTDEVKSLVARQVEAFNARDMQALAKIWSQNDDILLFDVAPPGRFQGWPEIARSFNNLFEKASEIHMTVENVRVQAGETLASATYDWAITGKMGEAALDDHGQATEIYRHEKDGWKLMHAHYSATPRAAAESAPAEKPSPAKAGKPVAGAAAAKPPAAHK